jgi:hypothetical protein
MKFNFPLLLLTFYIAYCSASEDCKSKNIFKDVYNDACKCNWNKTTDVVFSDGEFSERVEKKQTMCIKGQFCDTEKGCLDRTTIVECKNNDGTVANNDKCYCIHPNTKQFERCYSLRPYCENGKIHTHSHYDRNTHQGKINARKENEECRIHLHVKMSKCRTPCKCYKNDEDSISNALESSNNYEKCESKSGKLEQLCIRGYGVAHYCQGGESNCWCEASDGYSDHENFCTNGQSCTERGLCR